MLIVPYKAHVICTSPTVAPIALLSHALSLPLPDAASAILTPLLILKNAQHLAVLGPSCLKSYLPGALSPRY